MKKIFYTKKFLRAFKKLFLNIQDTYRQQEKLFIKNLFDKKLRTHKLKGANYYSFSVNYKIRVIFQKNKVITLINIGDHSLYREL